MATVAENAVELTVRRADPDYYDAMTEVAPGIPSINSSPSDVIRGLLSNIREICSSGTAAEGEPNVKVWPVNEPGTRSLQRTRYERASPAEPPLRAAVHRLGDKVLRVLAFDEFRDVVLKPLGGDWTDAGEAGKRDFADELEVIRSTLVQHPDLCIVDGKFLASGPSERAA